MCKVKFHDIAEGVNEGKVGEIFVKIGDTVKEGDDLLVVETDKITTPLTSPVDGVILKINIKTGDDIVVGDVLLSINDGSNDDTSSSSSANNDNKKNSDLLPPDDENASVVGTVTVGNTTIPSRNQAAKTTIVNETIIASPLVRRIAREKNIDLKQIKGTGINGKIMKSDLDNFKGKLTSLNKVDKPFHNKIKNTSLSLVPADEIAMSYMEKASPVRMAIARAMTTSVYTLPHTCLMDEIDITKIYNLKKEYKEKWQKENIKLSFMPFIIKAVSIASIKFPELNARFNIDQKEIIFINYQNIGIAANTKSGLKVPVMKKIRGRSILKIGEKLSTIITKIKKDKFVTDDFSDGTFTITNYGVLGGRYATPVINYPESAILGTGRIETLPRYDKNGELKPAKIMPLSLSFDHRLIDGAIAAQFLTFLRNILSEPGLLAIY